MRQLSQTRVDKSKVNAHHPTSLCVDSRLFIALTFAGLSAVSLAAVAYPYAIYPAVLRRIRKNAVVPAKGPEASAATVSLLFCAFNEEQSLGAKIENLRTLKAGRPDLQILAYDDVSSDGTYELLSKASDVLTVVRGSTRAGKAAGMKALVQAASGDILVFTDANVLLAPDAIDRLTSYYGDPGVGGVCGTLVYAADPESVTSWTGAAYWRLDETLRSLESDTGNVIGADGSLFSVRRSLYPDFPDTVLDDFTVSMNVVFQGSRLIKAPDAFAYENSVARRTDELRRKVRIGTRAYHTHLFLLPQLRRMSGLDKFKYISRKLLRWYGGIFIVAAGLFGLAAVTQISAAAGLALALAVIALMIQSIRTVSGPLARLGDIVLAIFATLIGVFRAMRGDIVATWEPAKSR
jgi:cellulose synthase/poly-beta-1,6-N-acetylglucosamine synthase-like glycosyltransferase